MAPQKPTGKHNGSSSGVRGARVQKQRKKHKVVLESAGNKDDDDKLRVVLSFHAEPPPGYTFIPAGNTQLTAAMKSFAKKGNHQVMAVSATPHAARHELSREVHRIGYHIPTEVVSQVCSHYGIRLDSSGRLIGEQESEKLFMKISQKGQVVLNENIRDQVTINTEAKEIIRDLFPKIPDNDLFQIIKTAFQLGDNKVGTAEEIPLVRRAQLSVVAHIRHSYTNYDRLLRQLPYNDARHSVEKPTLQKLVEWRGDLSDHTEESKKAVDEAVREVVVLSDEESSDSELEEGQVIENEHLKVEPVRKQARPVIATEQRPVTPGEVSSGEDAPQGYRYIAPVSRKRPIVALQNELPSRQQQNRYALWDQVRHEYRSSLHTREPAQVITRIPLDEPVIRTEPGSREVVYGRVPPARYPMDAPEPAHVVRPPSPPRLFQGADGRIYERHNTRVVSRPPIQRIYTPPSTQTYSSQNLARRSASPRSGRVQAHRRTPSFRDDGTVIPSIEQTEEQYNSPGIPQQSPMQRHGRQEHGSGQLIDLTSSAQKATERIRLDSSPPSSPFIGRDRRPMVPVEQYDSNVAPRRHMIELHDSMPAASYQHDRSYVIRQHPSQVHLPQSRIYTPDDGKYVSVERYPIHEHTQDVRPTQYTPQRIRPVLDNGYYVVDDMRSAPIQFSTQSSQAPSRYIVLDHPQPMDGVERMYSARY